MQQATYQGLHVRDARDAHVVFEAVRQGFLTPVVKRLNETERALLIRPGAIFVWFESEDESGLKRWTDGRVWSQSRMREPYLFYDERTPYDLTKAATEASLGPSIRFIDGIARPGPSSSAVSHQDRTTNHHPGLVKQTYSVWVMVRPNTRPQKWHLTAYFTYAELPHLPTIDCDPNLRTVIVPPGIYRSAKTRTRTDDDELPGRGGSPVSSAPNSYVTPMLTLPSLSTLQVTPPPPGPPPHMSYGTRLPEDERLIHMLNSRHVT